VKPEAVYLVHAIGRFLGGSPPVEAPDPGSLNWSTLLDLADAHAVTPMLFEAVKDDPIPEAGRRRLREDVRRATEWSMAQTGELIRLAAFFEIRGTRAKSPPQVSAARRMPSFL
jgi:hypothetical protein